MLKSEMKNHMNPEIREHLLESLKLPLTLSQMMKNLIEKENLAAAAEVGAQIHSELSEFRDFLQSLVKEEAKPADTIVADPAVPSVPPSAG